MITVPLAEGQPGDDPKTVIIVKDIQNDEPYAGSISIPRSIFLEGDLNVSHTQWVTLFDDQGDDEYDGAMGINDDEEPRILFEFVIQEYQPPQQHIEEPPVQQEESPYRDQVEEEVFEQPKPEHAEPPVAAVPEQRKKLDTKKPSKTYMNPIGNPKKRDGHQPEPPAPARTSTVSKGNKSKPSKKQLNTRNDLIVQARDSAIGEKLPTR